MGAHRSYDRESVDRRAVAGGAVLQAAAFTVAYYLGGPFAALVPTFVVGGVVAGAASDNFRQEFVDGAFGACAGAVLSLVGLASLVWVGTAPLPTWMQIDAVLITGLIAVFVLLLVLPAVGAVGAVLGHTTATARRAVGR